MKSWMLILTVAAAFDVWAAETIPYPAALDAAAVREDRLDNLNKNALTLGNGDLNGLLWEHAGVLCLRVAKNDIWDARVDTSQDPPLMKVDVARRKWTGGMDSMGGGKNIPSWARPYPRPHCAALVRIGRPGSAAANER